MGSGEYCFISLNEKCVLTFKLHLNINLQFVSFRWGIMNNNHPILRNQLDFLRRFTIFTDQTSHVVWSELKLYWLLHQMFGRLRHNMFIVSHLFFSILHGNFTVFISSYTIYIFIYIYIPLWRGRKSRHPYF